MFVSRFLPSRADILFSCLWCGLALSGHCNELSSNVKHPDLLMDHNANRSHEVWCWRGLGSIREIEGFYYGRDPQVAGAGFIRGKPQVIMRRSVHSLSAGLVRLEAVKKMMNIRAELES